MTGGIVISADFSEPGGPILAGPAESELQATKVRVAQSRNARLAAVKSLGRGFDRAVVLDQSFDRDRGWITRRSKFMRRRARGAGPPALRGTQGEP